MVAVRGDFGTPLLRGDFAAVVARLAAGLRAADVRLDPELDDFARLVFVFGFEPVALARALVDRLPVERFADDLRAPPEELRDEAVEPPLPVLAEPSTLHLPDITRWAASATASAMIEPSLVAVETTLFAACDALSAASSPASRILRRADGLALIAAAAAASPAASISLLIAALASLSTVESFERDKPDDDFEEDLEELLRADLAIAQSPSVAGKTLQGCNGSLMIKAMRRIRIC